MAVVIPIQQTHSKALALLAAGHTITETATLVEWPPSSVRTLAKGQKGWLVDDNGHVYDPSQTGYQVRVPDTVDPTDLAWARKRKSGQEAEPQTPPGDADELLARAGKVDDRRVRAAVDAVRAGLAKLHERCPGAGPGGGAR